MYSLPAVHCRSMSIVKSCVQEADLLLIAILNRQYSLQLFLELDLLVKPNGDLGKKQTELFCLRNVNIGFNRGLLKIIVKQKIFSPVKFNETFDQGQSRRKSIGNRQGPS